MFYRVIETSGSLGEQEMLLEHMSQRQVFPLRFQDLQNLHQYFYNSIETHRTCFTLLFESTANHQKLKTAC